MSSKDAWNKADLINSTDSVDFLVFLQILGACKHVFTWLTNKEFLFFFFFDEVDLLQDNYTGATVNMDRSVLEEK